MSDRCVLCRAGRAPFASLFTQQSVNRINVNNMNELLIYSDGKIVPSSEVITRNSFKGGRPKDEEIEPTTNAKKVAINSIKKQSKISSFFNQNN